MKKIFVLLITVLLFGSVYAQRTHKPVPAWNTGKRSVVNFRSFRVMTPPPAGKSIYTPAEFAPMEGILIQVPVGWNELYPYYSQMIKSIIAAGAIPYIIADSTYRYMGQTYNDIEDITDEVLTPNDIDVDDVVFLDYDYDANWTRDYGPWYIYLDGKRAIVNQEYYEDRPDDNAINGKLATLWDEEIFSTSLSTEGGNFMTDGLGTCWASTGVVDINTNDYGWTQAEVDAVYEDYLNCSNGIHHPVPLPDESTTHIDMFSKILDQNTIIVSSSTIELGATQAEINALDAAALFYKNTPKPDGGEWKIVRIPMTFGDYSYDGENWRVQYTHSNSTIVNDHVIIPIYKRGTDAEALAIYQELLPRHTVVGIDSNEMIVWGGSIHCTTMQLPVIDYTECGNGVVDSGEECDTYFTDGTECKDLEGFNSGLLKCKSDCTFETAECSVDGGDTGNTGDTGNSGNTSDTGDTGNTGDTADTSDTSDTGNTVMDDSDLIEQSDSQEVPDSSRSIKSGGCSILIF